MPKERILITVKTYPDLSESYGETVCTAGIREDGSWVRIYPVPFRRLNEEQQYKKFDWIDCELIKNRKDQRPESYRPINENQFDPVGHIGTNNNWQERRKLVLQASHVYTCRQTLIDAAKSNTMSLAIFKPTRIIRFFWKGQTEREWDPSKIHAMRNPAQIDLFEEEQWRKTFQIIPKLPYRFFYQFEDENGKQVQCKYLTGKSAHYIGIAYAIPMGMK